MSRSPLKGRSAYPVWRELETRWADNDAYGHVNNVVHYSWFDTAVNAWLIENGYGQQLVVSQDIDAKYLLLRYGGSGYAHIVNNIVPRMRRKGFAESDIFSILVGTPRRLMTLVEPRGN